jgi:hypothetical protein
LVDGAGSWELSPSVSGPAGSFFLPSNAGVLYPYKGHDIEKCLGDGEWHFLGDSMARELMLDIATRTLEKGEPPVKYEKHAV